MGWTVTDAASSRPFQRGKCPAILGNLNKQDLIKIQAQMCHASKIPVMKKRNAKRTKREEFVDRKN